MLSQSASRCVHVAVDYAVSGPWVCAKSAKGHIRFGLGQIGFSHRIRMSFQACIFGRPPNTVDRGFIIVSMKISELFDPTRAGGEANVAKSLHTVDFKTIGARKSEFCGALRG